MKVIIAGSRSIRDMTTVRAAIKWSGWENTITEVISGMCTVWDPARRERVDTVDTLAVKWAEERGLPVSKFHARWKVYGHDAGFIRNGDMADYAAGYEGSGLLAVWDGKSNGTSDMIFKAERKNLLVKVYCERGL